MLYSTSAEGLYRIPGPTACLKMLNKVFMKSWRKEKKFHDWTWAALSPQPSDLCYKSTRWSGIRTKWTLVYFTAQVLKGSYTACLKMLNKMCASFTSYDGNACIQ